MRSPNKEIEAVLGDYYDFEIPQELIDELSTIVQDAFDDGAGMGWDEGHADGYDDGYHEGYDRGYEDGLNADE